MLILVGFGQHVSTMSMTDYESLAPKEQGGPLKRRFEEYEGLEHGCQNCNHLFTIGEEHVFGQQGNQSETIVDGDGVGWIVVLACPECGYTIREKKWDKRIR